jgi:hypothetical protein
MRIESKRVQPGKIKVKQVTFLTFILLAIFFCLFLNLIEPRLLPLISHHAFRVVYGEYNNRTKTNGGYSQLSHWYLRLFPNSCQRCDRRCGEILWCRPNLDGWVSWARDCSWCSRWWNLGGFSLSAPAAMVQSTRLKAIAIASNRIDTFIIGQERRLMRKTWNGTTWSEWGNLGGFCKQGIAVTNFCEQRQDVFTIGADNAVYQITWDGSAWTDWTSLGGFGLSAPAAVSWGENRIDLFVRGSDHAIYQKSWNGTAWSEWTSLGGLWLYAPAVASWGANRLDVFAVGVDNVVYRKYSNGVTWSAWEKIGGTSISAPGAVSRGVNQLDVFVVGGDNSIYRNSLG